MKKTLAIFSVLAGSFLAGGLGAPYEAIPTESIGRMTGSINQVTQQATDSENYQDKQWEQEEENGNTTDIEKEKIRQQEEEAQHEEIEIDSYRFDEPSPKTYNEN